MADRFFLDAPARQSSLDKIRVVLFEPQDLVNVAGVVRAMMNFGLTDLVLVNPVAWDRWRVEGMSHNSARVLDRVRIVATLDEALGDVTFVAGTTARARRLKRNVVFPSVAAPDLLDRASEGTVAILFGREDKGLSNEAIDRCNVVLTIPTHPDHASLNLAQATLLIAWELFSAAGADALSPRPARHGDQAPPEQADLERLFADAEKALESIDFFKTRKSEPIMTALRRGIFRFDLDAREAKLVRAFFIEVVKWAERQRSL